MTLKNVYLNANKSSWPLMDAERLTVQGNYVRHLLTDDSITPELRDEIIINVAFTEWYSVFGELFVRSYRLKANLDKNTNDYDIYDEKYVAPTAKLYHEILTAIQEGAEKEYDRFYLVGSNLKQLEQHILDALTEAPYYAHECYTVRRMINLITHTLYGKHIYELSIGKTTGIYKAIGENKKIYFQQALIIPKEAPRIVYKYKQDIEFVDNTSRVYEDVNDVNVAIANEVINRSPLIEDRVIGGKTNEEESTDMANEEVPVGKLEDDIHYIPTEEDNYGYKVIDTTKEESTKSPEVEVDLDVINPIVEEKDINQKRDIRCKPDEVKKQDELFKDTLILEGLRLAHDEYVETQRKLKEEKDSAREVLLEAIFNEVDASKIKSIAGNEDYLKDLARIYNKLQKKEQKKHKKASKKQKGKGKKGKKK